METKIRRVNMDCQDETVNFVSVFLEANLIREFATQYDHLLNSLNTRDGRSNIWGRSSPVLSCPGLRLEMATTK